MQAMHAGSEPNLFVVHRDDNFQRECLGLGMGGLAGVRSED
jgi:hypothetical protein